MSLVACAGTRVVGGWLWQAVWGAMVVIAVVPHCDGVAELPL